MKKCFTRDLYFFSFQSKGRHTVNSDEEQFFLYKHWSEWCFWTLCISVMLPLFYSEINYAGKPLHPNNYAVYHAQLNSLNILYHFRLIIKLVSFISGGKCPGQPCTLIFMLVVCFEGYLTWINFVPRRTEWCELHHRDLFKLIDVRIWTNQEFSEFISRKILLETGVQCYAIRLWKNASLLMPLQPDICLCFTI